VDIVNAADTSIGILVPGLGDAMQAMKAGLLEIGDIFVINKCEQEGAEGLEQDLRVMLEMGGERVAGWMPSMCRIEAINGEGIERHRAVLYREGFRQRQKQERVRTEFLESLNSSVKKGLVQRLSENGELDRMVEAVVQRKTHPYTLVEEIIRRFSRCIGQNGVTLG